VLAVRGGQSPCSFSTSDRFSLLEQARLAFEAELVPGPGSLGLEIEPIESFWRNYMRKPAGDAHSEAGQLVDLPWIVWSSVGSISSFMLASM